MIKNNKQESLLSRLPQVRGRISEQASLAELCWFRVGGVADVLFTPADVADLQEFLQNTPSDIPISIFGAGSNLLVRDGGVRGVCIRLMGGFAGVEEQEGGVFYAGAATLDAKLAQVAGAAGRSGLEFYRGIPGSVGGAIAMNAGAYGFDTSEVLKYVDALDRNGKALRLTPEQLKLSYRHNGYEDFVIYIGAAFATSAGDPAAIKQKMEEIMSQRGDTQPTKSRTSGSTFKNPPQAKAWKLIDAAGCRGLRCGGAEISQLHCNFLINHGQATAFDLETLGETARARVLESSGTKLEWEIKRIGEAQ